MVSKIAFIGGDLRMPEAARFSGSRCDTLSVYGFDKYEYCYECFGITEETSMETALFGAEAVVLGLPCIANKEYIYAPYCSKEISAQKLLSCISAGAWVFCGKPSMEFIEAAQKKNIILHDYFSREELTLKNAMITAEGAIQTAMQETPYTINGSRCLVIGYGRIGKMLSRLLSGLDAQVTCSARKQSDLALISCNGLKCIETQNIIETISSYDIIFNTVPQCVLPETVLSFVRPDTLIIDLASKPGGLDFECAAQFGLKVIWATALPGKVAPETSGKIIADTIFNIISEQTRR